MESCEDKTDEECMSTIDSYWCSVFNVVTKNKRLCNEATEGGCNECVNTQVFPFHYSRETYEDIVPLITNPETCDWYPDINLCSFGSYNSSHGVKQDSCIVFEPTPAVGTRFPELLGQTVKYAIEYLKMRYGEGTLDINVLTMDTTSTTVIRAGRVRLRVEGRKHKDSKIALVPVVG